VATPLDSVRMQEMGDAFGYACGDPCGEGDTSFFGYFCVTAQHVSLLAERMGQWGALTTGLR
jgi:hypothetical protein